MSGGDEVRNQMDRVAQLTEVEIQHHEVGGVERQVGEQLSDNGGQWQDPGRDARASQRGTQRLGQELVILQDRDPSHDQRTSRSGVGTRTIGCWAAR